jgi:hypothetical protein
MTRFFYLTLLLKTALLLLANQAFAQQTRTQGFEGSGSDNWAFGASPAAYNDVAAEDFWTDTTATNQISSASGNRFWFMLDLENPGGGGAFFHTLNFEAIDVSAFSNNTLTFKYYTIGYEAADSIGYILETDNGTGWDFSRYVDLDRNTLGWATVEVPVPTNAPFVRLRLMAKQNGGSDFAGFDDVQLVSANGDIVAPQVLDAKVLNANTIRFAFSEALDATAENTANYTGVANLASAQRSASGDTVTLAFSAPFVNGQANTLSVDGVKDLAGNTNTPFVFPFIFNNTTPDLVITEINYNPPSNDPDLLEFIEIYNNEDQPVAIGGLQLGGLVSLTFPELTLPAGGIFLAAAYKAECEAFFSGQTFYQWNNSTALTNGGNILTIRNSEGTLIDTVQYDDVFPWPTEPDGFGPSAELLSPALDNNDGANWKASATPTSTAGTFASPGTVAFVTLPTIGFNAARSIFQENADTVSVRVNVNNMTVAFAEAKLRVVSASTAVGAEDYVLLDTTVTFLQIAPDPFLAKIKLVDDSDVRNSRYLILELTDFVASEAGSIREHALLINDDDTPVPQPQANSPVTLTHLGSFAVDTVTATAEISAYDPVSKRLFTTNIEQNRLEIIDFKNPVALTKFASIDISAYGGGINSVAFANGAVAVAIDDTLITNPGRVVFFNTDGVFLSQVTVGALPDHVNFTPDGAKLLVANEGEPADDYSVDPEGSISVIDMTPGAAALTQANVTNLGFTQFDADIDALRAAGVRIFGPTNNVSQNIEPEYITVDAAGKKAWVTLQEANALAIVDLENNVVSAIVPLGLKDWSNYGLDASDQAPGIFFNNWNVKGIYQPDAIAHWSAGGNEYLITANEGDVREWDAYAEIVRVNASAYQLDSAAFPDAKYLKRAELLGRLNVSTATGDTDGDGDFDEIHTFGGRSISIWNAATGQLVWDSGDDLERITAADPAFGSIFNASNSNNTRKNRSDDKGPEPEGVALGTIDGRNYAFTALERVGGVLVYDVTDPTAPQFVQWINTRSTTAVSGDLGAEGILFIPKDQSPNKRDLVVVSNEISGTVSVFQVDVDKTKTGEYGLVKYAFDETPAIGVYGDTILEGGISGLMYRDGSFRFIADRGPNADAVNSPLSGGQTTLVFPFPDYAPKVWQVKPNNGILEVEDFDFVKRPDGTGASGLPLPAGQGNTGEVAWSDTLAILVPNDPWGLDSEGLIQDNEGNFWVCDEYGTSIWKLDANFKVLNRYTPFPKETEDLPLDTLLGKRRANRGLEGIAYTPNGKIFAMLQSPANNPTVATGNNSRIHRLVELDPATGAMRTFVYVHDPVLGEIRSRDWKIGDMAAVNNEEFLVLEHAERNGWNAKNVYKFNIAGATPVIGDSFGGLTLEQLDPAGLAANGIVPVQKERFADLLELGWERQHDKPEGLAILNDSSFAVINDNDFGIASPAADGKIVLTGKTTRLYVYTLPSDKRLDYVSPYCEVALGEDVAVCGQGDIELDIFGQGFSNATWSDSSSNLFLFATEPGVYSVEAVTDFGCRSRDTMVFEEHPFPAIDLGPNLDFCQGDTISVLLDAGNPGSDYNWLSGDSTQTIVATASGSYAVTVTNEFGCESSDVVFINLNFNPFINLGTDKSICEGNVATLDAGIAGVTYLWSTGDTTQTIVTGTANAYALTVTDFKGCTGSDEVLLAVNPNPVVDLGQDSTICEGQTLTLDAGNAGASYNWSTGASTQTIEAGASDLYEVTVTNAFGCTASGDVAVSVVICPGTDEPALRKVSVFPNPTSGALTVQFSELPAKTIHLSVVNTIGQVVLAKQQVTDLNTALDLSQLPKGLYLLRLQSGTSVETVRVVVQ